MKAKNFTELASQWLYEKGHLAESSRERYAKAIVEISRIISSLNGSLATELQQWQTKRRAELSSSSFATELYVLQSVLDYGLRHGKPKENCWAQLKAGKIRNKSFTIPTRENFEAIVTELFAQPGGKIVAEFVLCLGLSGMRHGEAASLLWSQVDFVAGNFSPDGKTGSRVVPLFPKLREQLIRLAAEQPDRVPHDRVFGHVDTEYRITKACAKLGLPRYRPAHDFRHMRCKLWLEQVGMANAHVAAAWAGHSVTTFLQRYTNHVAESHSAQLAATVT